MPRFRNKPKEIEAVQWNGQSPRAVADALGVMNKGFMLRHCVTDYGVDISSFEVTTLEGVMSASLGDWIIKGIQGEVYPCKPDIFEATYEPIT